MYTHPQLAQRLAQAKNEEARSRMQHAPALRAAMLERRTPAVPVSTHREGCTEPMLASITRRRHPRSLGTNAR